MHANITGEVRVQKCKFSWNCNWECYVANLMYAFSEHQVSFWKVAQSWCQVPLQGQGRLKTPPPPHLHRHKIVLQTESKASLTGRATAWQKLYLSNNIRLLPHRPDPHVTRPQTTHLFVSKWHLILWTISLQSTLSG